uniref:Uncharacterized protein n=1 Tax=Candidatus Kentrum sp. DK TaxID=2126562 RepID=A0A450SFF5_9GAMM|nr:MAG: hypothetical protein BECKDK2373C_GA0170839_103219 [Candidatus Kentron sp. DK]
MVDGNIEPFQQTLRRFQVMNVGEPLLDIGENGGRKVESLSVLADQAVGVADDGLIAE